ncbi:MAG: hypothetical protein KBT34_14855 [Prevotella sp.]|nr:hypothetical protein [Candidatus Prevotella equi]
MKKYFIITVDTEGDNLWVYNHGDEITTSNTNYIVRFQDLCTKFNFAPVYLTNFEMINDNGFVDFVKPLSHANKCEVGIHIHAWNNPPIYQFSKNINQQSYLIEYPIDIMRQKFQTTYNLISEKIGIKPVSHRAGRWAMNNQYFKILEEFNIKVDCSYTPHVDWSRNIGARTGGSDYTNVGNEIRMIGNVLEVPMSIFKTKEKIRIGKKQQLINILCFKAQPKKIIWLRPAQSSLEDMKKNVDFVLGEESLDHLEFMIHSSELMPGGSPYFKNEESIENLYQVMEELFKYISFKGFVGCTLKDYYNYAMSQN